GHGLHYGAPMPFQHLPGRCLHAERSVAREIHRHTGEGRQPLSFVAEEVREILACLGFRKLEEVIGRTDLLYQMSRGSEELDDLDLNPLLVQADPGNYARYSTQKGRNEVPDTLDAQIEKDA